MAMLVEKRRKTKFVLTPVAKPLWTSESTGMQFGKRLMEKMGWSTGKGLGASEQGIAEPLRSSFKQDSKGMGYKGHGDPFENLDHFNALLASLAGKESEQNNFESLEEKSKHSRSRVHYKKFTRGKDLSKCSELDLTCIVGTGRKVEEIEQEERCDDRTGEQEHSHGVTTINSGSIADYFKGKLDRLKGGDTDLSKTQNNIEEDVRNGEEEKVAEEVNGGAKEESGLAQEKIKRKKKHKHKIENIEEKSIGVESLEDSNETKKKKRKKIEHDEEPIRLLEEPFEEEKIHRKKKKKKDKERAIALEVSQDLPSELKRKKKNKKRDKREKSDEEENSADRLKETVSNEMNRTMEDIEISTLQEKDGNEVCSKQVTEANCPNVSSREGNTLKSKELRKASKKFIGSNLKELPGYGNVRSLK